MASPSLDLADRLARHDAEIHHLRGWQKTQNGSLMRMQQDVADLRVEVAEQIGAVKAELQSEIANLRAEQNAAFERLTQIVWRAAGVTLSGFALLLTVAGIVLALAR